MPGGDRSEADELLAAGWRQGRPYEPRRSGPVERGHNVPSTWIEFGRVRAMRWLAVRRAGLPTR